MASFNTGVRPSQIMDVSDKAFVAVVPAADGVDKRYSLSKRMTEWKFLPGEKEPVLFAQTWYAKKIGLAA